MSVFINGMDMPRDCLHCPMIRLGKYGEAECFADESNYAHYIQIDDLFYGHRQDWCPLQEIEK